MRQYGRVESVNPGGIVISVIRSSSCGSCESCSGGCELKSQRVTAEYKEGIKEGDTVIFEMKSSRVLFAAFLVYITPLLVLLLSYAISTAAGAGENAAILISVLSMVLWFFCVHILDKKLKQYYKHSIISRIGEQNVRV